MAEEIGDGTGLRYGVAESVVGIGGNGFAGGIEVAGNISVVVVERDVDGIIDCKIQQPAPPVPCRSPEIRLSSMSYEGVVSRRGAAPQRLKIKVYCV